LQTREINGFCGISLQHKIDRTVAEAAIAVVKKKFVGSLIQIV